MANDKVRRLLDVSKIVIRDCCLSGGAIVAANSSKDYFPREAKNYRFVWPRDASYTCIAAGLLGMRDIQEPFFEWCMKAEGWARTGLFYEKYYVNGRKALRHFQPDQTGSVLLAVHDYYKDDDGVPARFEQLVRKSADGLCRVWSKDHFRVVTQDLWEERLCFPDLKENFMYSLAVCYRGLMCANELIPNELWVRVAGEMKDALLMASNDKGHFYRSFGKIPDERVDASLPGLVWPAGVVQADDLRMVKTVSLIEGRIVRDFGVYRYEHDEYDGWMYRKNVHRKKGAGYWPLLSLWMAVYYLELGDKATALKYYNKVLLDVGDDGFIPEQVFDNDVQVSVSPLCWAHSMFVIASKRLGYL
ncbi:MAG: glycoside hydrolase family 15 protein [archaeon]